MKRYALLTDHLIGKAFQLKIMEVRERYYYLSNKEEDAKLTKQK